MDESADVGEGREGKPFDDLGRKGFAQLPQTIEEMKTIIFDAGECFGFGVARKRKMLKVAFEGAGVEDHAFGFEKPFVVERGVVNDEVDHVGAAPVFVAVNDRAVNEVGVVGVAKFESDDAGGVTAQKFLALHAQLAAHVRGERALAASDGGLIKFHIALPADERKLNRVQNGGFAHTVNPDEIGCANAGDGDVFKIMPVDEADAGEGFH